MDQASPLLWKNRTKRRRASNPGEMYNEQGASEADIDSDSGYCSPKHNQGAGVTQRTAENTAAAPVGPLLTGSVGSLVGESSDLEKPNAGITCYLNLMLFK